MPNKPERWRTSAAKATRARQLRQEQTPAEALVWQHLRNHRMQGVHFRRRHPIGRFIVDFCCVQHRVVIEIDGPVHEQQAEYDHLRTEALQALGYHVLRFTNNDVEHNLAGVLFQVEQRLRTDS